MLVPVIPSLGRSIFEYDKYKLVIINVIWKGDTNSKNDIKTENYTGSVLANNNQENSETELERKLENILETIKNVGKVNVLLNYSESNLWKKMFKALKD